MEKIFVNKELCIKCGGKEFVYKEINVSYNNFDFRIYGRVDGLLYDNKYDKFTLLEFKFITQLSAKECLEKGITSSVNLNAVIDTTSNQPLTTIYNARTETTAKAEELYVDHYYRAYSSPKIMMTATMKNSNINLFNLYNSTVLNKKFFIQSMNFDVRMDKKEITFKEI